MRSEQAKVLSEQLFASRSRSQGPVYLHSQSAATLLQAAQDVVAEIGKGSHDLNIFAPSAWHAVIFLWWLAKRAATLETVERPLDRALVRSRLIFRGQKARYDLTPSIQRLPQEDNLPHRAAIQILCTALNHILHQSPDELLRAFWESVSLRETACIAQHYKSNAGPQTFLLDWSFDPFVAVHFATRHAWYGESDEAAVYILSFKQAASLHMAIVAPPLFAGRLYDQAGLFLDTEASLQDLTPHHVLRIRFPVEGCVELPRVADKPYDPLESDPFFGPLITRTMACANSLTRQQCRDLLQTSPVDIHEYTREISRDLELVAPWSAAVRLLMHSTDRPNEISFIENMIVRFIDWAAFRAKLDAPKPEYYYDPAALAAIAQTSPSIFTALAKTNKILSSLGKKPDSRTTLIMQALGAG